MGVTIDIGSFHNCAIEKLIKTDFTDFKTVNF